MLMAKIEGSSFKAVKIVIADNRSIAKTKGILIDTSKCDTS